MPGLDPGIHAFLASAKTWMAGSSPAMTARFFAAILPYSIVTGEKSTNQLFGCTKPLIFGLIARGATSWAT